MSVWLPTAPCTPGSCVTDPERPAPVALRVARAAGCLAVLLAGIALTPAVRLLGAARQERAIRLWARTVLASLGVRTTISTEQAVPGAALLVANHISWLDILLVAAARPGRMLAKTEVRRWPLVGPLAAWGGTIFLDRDRLRALPGTVAEIAAALRSGRRVVVFPEGSTWCGRAAGRFRPALFQAAVDAGAPVQPIAIRYRLSGGAATTTPAFVGEDGLLSSLGRVLALRGLQAELTLRPAIPAAPPADRRGLARAAQRSVHGEPPPAAPAHATAGLQAAGVQAAADLHAA